MLRVKKASACLAALLLAATAPPALAAWNYQEEKDASSNADVYTRAINSVVTPAGEIFHLLVACEVHLNMYLVIPDEIADQDKVKIHFRVDRNPPHDTTWQPHVPKGEKSKSLRVPSADWKIIQTEAHGQHSQLTLDITVPDEAPRSVTFDMRGYDVAAGRVIKDCADLGQHIDDEQSQPTAAMPAPARN